MGVDQNFLDVIHSYGCSALGIKCDALKKMNVGYSFTVLKSQTPGKS